jgi:hypothetical protein
MRTPISTPFLFIQHYPMGEIIKINTPFLTNEYNIQIKFTSLKEHFSNYFESTIAIPNLFYDIKHGIEIAFNKLEFFLKSIKESNIYFLPEENIFFSLDNILNFKNKLKIEKAQKGHYTEDENEFIIMHINALRMIDCLEYFLKRTKKNEHMQAFLKNIKYMIILNLKCSSVIDDEKEVNLKEILY